MGSHGLQQLHPGKDNLLREGCLHILGKQSFTYSEKLTEMKTTLCSADRLCMESHICNEVLHTEVCLILQRNSWCAMSSNHVLTPALSMISSYSYVYSFNTP